MNLDVTYRNVRPSDRLKGRAEKKFQKVAKHLREPIDAHLVLREEKHLKIAEFTVSGSGEVFKVEEHTSDMFASIDGLMTIRSLDEQDVFIKILEEGAPVSALNYYPNDKKAVFGNMKGRIIFVDIAKMRVQKDFLAVDGPVWDAVYNKKNEAVIIGGLDDTLIEWRLKSFHSNYFV